MPRNRRGTRGRGQEGGRLAERMSKELRTREKEAQFLGNLVIGRAVEQSWLDTFLVAFNHLTPAMTDLRYKSTPGVTYIFGHEMITSPQYAHQAATLRNPETNALVEAMSELVASLCSTGKLDEATATQPQNFTLASLERTKITPVGCRLTAKVIDQTGLPYSSGLLLGGEKEVLTHQVGTPWTPDIVSGKLPLMNVNLGQIRYQEKFTEEDANELFQYLDKAVMLQAVGPSEKEQE